ncbi:MAG: GAF domain-containing protein, partial [Actinobacteria bacterium]|nr:GAF domain-containing protein [Actinomycetota bacterium]
MDYCDRHVRLLTETIEAVNSSLDLEEVLELVATKVANALEADACFVYLYDARVGELVLRATFGTKVEEMTHRPRMRPGEGITGTAAELRAPVALPKQAHLDPRFKNFPNLPEDEYESILAVPILARGERLEGALNVRTREPREFTADEIDLLLAIAAQVAQSIEHAKLYAEAQRRVHELEALARISEAVSESLYLEELLEAIVKTTMDALHATGAALVLEDGKIAWPEGRADAHAIRQPLRWRGRQIGELVADRATPFTQDDRELLASIAQHAAVALEHGRAVLRGVLAQEIHHRVKNNLQTVASLLRLQARAEDDVDPRKALEDSVNRILAIAAVHEVLTERRDEDVDLAELVERLRAMLVQGLGAAREVDAALEPVSLGGNRATALALVFSELLQNALEHGGPHVHVELLRQNGEGILAIADDGRGIGEPKNGTGLSIVRALVR